MTLLVLGRSLTPYNRPLADKDACNVPLEGPRSRRAPRIYEAHCPSQLCCDAVASKPLHMLTAEIGTGPAELRDAQSGQLSVGLQTSSAWSTPIQLRLIVTDAVEKVRDELRKGPLVPTLLLTAAEFARGGMLTRDQRTLDATNATDAYAPHAAAASGSGRQMRLASVLRF